MVIIKPMTDDQRKAAALGLKRAAKNLRMAIAGFSKVWLTLPNHIKKEVRGGK